MKTIAEFEAEVMEMHRNAGCTCHSTVKLSSPQMSTTGSVVALVEVEHDTACPVLVRARRLAARFFN